MSDELAVQQVLAHYVRAHDRRDGAAAAALFMPQARVTILYNNNPGGEPEVIGELVGREAIAQAVTHMMKPHPPRGWSHNAADGVLVEIDGDRATLDAQFMVFSILGDAKPAGGCDGGDGRDHADRVWLLHAEAGSRGRTVAHRVAAGSP